jgi:hypothetical protein
MAGHPVQIKNIEKKKYTTALVTLFCIHLRFSVIAAGNPNGGLTLEYGLPFQFHEDS